MIKKLVNLSFIILLVLPIWGCTNKDVENISGKSEKEIREIAYDWLDDSSKITVLNFENAKVEKYKDNNDHIVATKSEPVDITGKYTYKVTFKTEDEELLGTINIYIDSNNFEVIGSDFRE